LAGRQDPTETAAAVLGLKNEILTDRYCAEDGTLRKWSAQEVFKSGHHSHAKARAR
jgi:hypothetical protein